MVLPPRVCVLVYRMSYLTVATELLVSKSIDCLQIGNSFLRLVRPAQDYCALLIWLRWLQSIKHARLGLGLSHGLGILFLDGHHLHLPFQQKYQFVRNYWDLLYRGSGISRYLRVIMGFTGPRSFPQLAPLVESVHFFSQFSDRGLI